MKYIVVWNEPNLSQEWGYRTPNPAEYTELLKRTYRAVKAANPEVQVLAGALAPTLAPPGSEWAMNDLDYLQGMYDAGRKGLLRRARRPCLRLDLRRRTHRPARMR